MIAAACVFAQAFFVGAEIAIGACDPRPGCASAPTAGIAPRAVGRAAAGAARRSRSSTTLIGANLATLIAVAGARMYLREPRPVAAAGRAAGGAADARARPAGAQGDVQAHADQRGRASSRRCWTLVSWLLPPGGAGGLRLRRRLTRLAGTDRKKAFVTRDELALLIESEPETDKPEISADEREMIANVFELVRVHGRRADGAAVRGHRAARGRADRARPRSRSPTSSTRACRSTASRVDDIVGIVHVFDILQAGGRRQARRGRRSRRSRGPPTYVPETMKAIDLLRRSCRPSSSTSRSSSTSTAARSASCTIEDLLETIVGDIDDEYDTEPSPIRPERPGVWRVEARTAVARINQRARPRPARERRLRDHRRPADREVPPHPRRGRGADRCRRRRVEVVAATDRAIEVVRIAKKKK